MSGTVAQESLLEAYRSGAVSLPGAGTPWLDALRRRAFERFERIGFPTAREETWRHTPLAPLHRIPFRPSVRDSTAPEDRDGRIGPAYRVILGPSGGGVPANGDLPPGLRIRPLGEALEDAEAWLGRLADLETPGVGALNTALFDRGVFVELERDVVLDRPVHLVHASGADPEPSAAFPRVLVVAREGSRGVIVEEYRSAPGEAATLVAPVTELYLGENAKLDHIRLQEESERSFHVGAVVADQSAGSRLRSWSLAFGASFARVDIATRLGGEGARCSLEGIFAGRGTQHLDHHTRIEHASPQTTSRETYKGILDGKARGVFLGHILVRPNAQKIDANQTSRSIVLSPGARVNMKPWLEIYADDVRCTHGTTVGRLDEEALFYLRSRGLDLETARSILVRGFVQEVLTDLPLESLHENLDRFLLRWLAGSKNGGPEA